MSGGKKRRFKVEDVPTAECCGINLHPFIGMTLGEIVGAHGLSDHVVISNNLVSQFFSYVQSVACYQPGLDARFSDVELLANSDEVIGMHFTNCCYLKIVNRNDPKFHFRRKELTRDQYDAMVAACAMGTLSQQSVFRSLGINVDEEAARMREEHSRMVERLPDVPIIDYIDRINVRNRS